MYVELMYPVKVENRIAIFEILYTHITQNGSK